MSLDWMNRCFRSSLDPTDRLVMLSLADNASDTGLMWPSIPTTARKTGLSERSVQRAIQRFIEVGYIVLEQQASQHRPRLYRIIDLPAGAESIDEPAVTDSHLYDNSGVTLGHPEVTLGQSGVTHSRPGVTELVTLTIIEPSKKPSLEPPAAAVVAASHLDPRFGLAYRLWEQAIGMPPNPSSKTVIENILENLNPPMEWIEPAYQIMAAANVRRLDYLRAILERWKRDGKIDDGQRRTNGRPQEYDGDHPGWFYPPHFQRRADYEIFAVHHPDHEVVIEYEARSHPRRSQ